MQAAVVTSFDTPPRYEDIDAPTPEGPPTWSSTSWPRGSIPACGRRPTGRTTRAPTSCRSSPASTVWDEAPTGGCGTRAAGHHPGIDGGADRGRRTAQHPPPRGRGRDRPRCRDEPGDVLLGRAPPPTRLPGRTARPGAGRHGQRRSPGRTGGPASGRERRRGRRARPSATGHPRRRGRDGHGGPRRRPGHRRRTAHRGCARRRRRARLPVGQAGRQGDGRPGDGSRAAGETVDVGPDRLGGRPVGGHPLRRVAGSPTRDRREWAGLGDHRGDPRRAADARPRDLGRTLHRRRQPVPLADVEQVWRTDAYPNQRVVLLP